MSLKLDSLQAALTQLLRARAALLSSVGQPVGDSQGTAAQQVLERLHPIKRALEEAIASAEAEAQGEDQHVEILLQQRERALEQRSLVDDALREERRNLADVRRSLGELNRSIGRDRKRRDQVEGAPREERLQALDQRAKSSRETLAELKAETDAMSELLADVKVKNHGMDQRFQRLDQEHHEALATNQCAKAALGDAPNLVSYRWKKVAECSEADATFVRAKAHYEAFMDDLAADWAEKQAAYLTGVEDLKAEVKGLRLRLAEERALANSTLVAQATERQGAIHEVECHVASELGQLEGQRQQKHTHLRREVVLTTHQLEDAAIRAQKHLDTELKEATLVQHARVQREEALSEGVIQDEFASVLAAKREREELEKKNIKIKENYRVHAVKSKNYVKSLDKDRRDQLVDLWGRQ